MYKIKFLDCTVKEFETLRYANLTGANLTGAYLRCADLRCADLRCADLTGADLTGANLRGADLRGADLRSADLRSADLPHYQVCPETGAFRAFKKLLNGIIAELGIPRDAERTSSLVGRKCRASKAKVLSLSSGGTVAYSNYNPVLYVVGDYVYPDAYNGDIRIECTHGIHFFITRKEAEEY